MRQVHEIQTGLIADEQSFSNFFALKNCLGSPDTRNQWYHIVEQCQTVKSGLNPDQILGSVIKMSSDIKKEFIDACILSAEAKYSGNYKETKKHAKTVKVIVNQLEKSEEKKTILMELIKNDNIEVRIVAARIMLVLKYEIIAKVSFTFECKIGKRLD